MSFPRSSFSYATQNDYDWKPCFCLGKQSKASSLASYAKCPGGLLHRSPSMFVPSYYLSPLLLSPDFESPHDLSSVVPTFWARFFWFKAHKVTHYAGMKRPSHVHCNSKSPTQFNVAPYLQSLCQYFKLPASIFVGLMVSYDSYFKLQRTKST